MRWKLIFATFPFLTLSWPSTAQEVIPLQKRDTILAWRPLMVFDSVSVWPDHIIISTLHGKPYADSLLVKDPVRARIIWKDTIHHPDSVRIQYYRYPASWYGTDRLLTINPISSNAFNNRNPPGKSLLGGLQTSGIWEQGLLAGNRQNAVPQSRLDLRLSGAVSDNLQLQAHIRDDNLPMGYEGVTTTFKDLNRIYVRIQGPGWQAAGGDTLWQYHSPLLVFMRDNKGLGVGYETKTLKTGLAVAQQKGRYARSEFTLRTGELGPFALQTSSGEHEIYILHGSERIFLNGRRLTAGPGKDYQIDYARAQFRLNPELDINTGDRLTVEFQYAARQFVRWSSFDRAQWKQGKNTWEWFWYNETDNPHQSLLTVLDSTTTAWLRQNPGEEMLWVPGWREAGPQDEGILYERQNSGSGFYFVYSPAQNNAATRYTVQFSYVGPGKGNYLLDRYLAQGPVFVYAGTGQGEYVPYVRIRPPSDRRYTGLRWHRKTTNWNTDFQSVYHYRNPNLLFAGRKNRTNTLATAGKIGFEPRGKKISAHLIWQNLPAGYRSPDPVQQAGFLHIWDLEQLPAENFTHIEATGAWADSSFSVQTRLARLRLADSADLFQGGLTQNANFGQWQQHLHFRLVGGRAPAGRRGFYRLETALQHTKGNWRPFVLWQREQRNRTRSGLPDSLNYRLNQWETGLQWLLGKHTLRLSYRNNIADSIRHTRWNTTRAEHIVKARWQFKGRNNRFALQLRRLDNRPESQNPQWDLTARWAGNDSTRALRWNLQTTRAGSRIIRNEVIYRRVPQGQGQYVWNDYNGDGIAQDGEFEPAYYSDRADYIMVVLPSVKYLPAVRQQWNVDGTFDPVRRWAGLPALLRWRFRLQVQSDRSALRGHTGAFWVAGTAADERNDGLQWEQSWQPAEALRLRYRIDLRALTQFTYNGKNLHFNRLQHWTARYSTANGPWWEVFFSNRYTSSRSEFYVLKNLSVQSYEGGLAAGRRSKQNTWETRLMHTRRYAGTSPMTAWDARLRYDWHSNSRPDRFGLSVRYAAVQYEGNPLSPAGYVILEGLRPGNNWIFDLRWMRRLYRNIRLQVFYQMRKNGTEPVIHTGNIALQAVF